MPSSRRRSKSKPLSVQAVEMAVAVPQVVAHRVVRMSMAGMFPSARDQREFHLMGAEKVAALQESWQAMAAQAQQAQHQFTLAMLKSFSLPWSGGPQRAQDASVKLQHAAMDLLGTGMAPLHRRAVANAKRLRNTRLK